MQTKLPFFKKLLAVALFFVAIFCCKAFAVSVNAEESANTPPTAIATAEYTILAQGTCGTNLTWQLTSDYTLSITGTGEMNNYYSASVPWGNYASSIKKIDIGAEVTSIGTNAFYKCSGLTSVTLPDSVTSIGWYAFYNCTSLTNINIPDKVTSIGDSAFSDCISLTSINIPNTLTSIGGGAFYNCSGLKGVYISDIATWCKIDFSSGCRANPLFYAHNLYLNNELVTNLVIPDSVTTIGENAFCWCSGLTSVVIPNSVTWIGYSAFNGCDKLVEVINYSSLNITKGSSDYGYIGRNALNVKTSGTTDIVNKNGYLFYTYNNTNYLLGYSGTDTDLVLPDSYNGQKYEIYEYAFYDCKSLRRVVIPDSVTSIGYRAFEDCCGLTSVVIGNSVTTIGYGAFESCSGLTSVVIPESVTSIGEGAFENCSNLNYSEYDNAYYLGNDYLKELGLDSDSPTCKGFGFLEYYVCNSCQKRFTPEKNEIIFNFDSHGHFWSEWICDKEPTDQHNGNEFRSCLLCYAIDERTINKSESSCVSSILPEYKNWLMFLSVLCIAYMAKQKFNARAKK